MSDFNEQSPAGSQWRRIPVCFAMDLWPNFESVGKVILRGAIIFHTISKGETVKELGEKRQVEWELPCNWLSDFRKGKR